MCQFTERITSNYNSTKQGFVYFGVSLGEDPDETKASIFRYQGRLKGASRNVSDSCLFVCFVGQNASKCVIARRALQVAAATATLWVRVGKPDRRHSANLLGCERKYH
jgi:hypothetical protein